MGGATMNYDFGRKRNWRRTIWNELISRAVNPDGVALYLGGRDNYDRELLCKKGIKEWNIICVDRDIVTVTAVRKRGELCIHGDIFEVLSHFPKTPWVSCASIDLCCPINAKLVNTLRGYFDYSWFPWAINIMRGRETCPETREALGFHRNLVSNSNLAAIMEIKGNINASRYFTDANKYMHRGIILYYALIAQFFRLDISILQKHADEKGKTLKEVEIETLDCIIKNTNPHFYTYKSDSGQIFDSFVISPRYPKELDVINGVRFPDINNKHTARKISAVLAHRTMRMQA